MSQIIIIFLLLILASCGGFGPREREEGPVSFVSNLQPNKLSDSNWFGYQLTARADLLVIGAPKLAGKGAVFVYRKAGEEWKLEAQLTSQTGAEGEGFGSSLALGEKMILVGAPDANARGGASGVIYLFRFKEGKWQEEATVLPADAGGNNRFGFSIDLDWDQRRLIAGAPGQGGRGSAYLFELKDGIWTEVQKLNGSKVEASHEFGSSVSLDGSHAVVGAPAKLTVDHNGTVYAFKKVDSGWQEINALGDTTTGSFGAAVSLNGEHLVIGAPSSDNGTFSDLPGSCFLYRLRDTNWIRLQKFESSDLKAGDQYGASLVFDGTHLLVGAYNDDDRGKDSGSSYLYRLEKDRIRYRTKLAQDEKMDGTWFGFAAALVGKDLFIGSHLVPKGEDEEVGNVLQYRIN